MPHNKKDEKKPAVAAAADGKKGEADTKAAGVEKKASDSKTHKKK